MWIVLPVLPVLLGFAALNLLNDGQIDIISAAATGSFADQLELRFFNALVVFVAVGLFQVVGCAAVAIFAVLQILRLPKEARQNSLIVLAGSILLVLLISFGARVDGYDGALNIAYRSTCAVLVKAQVADHILPTGCTEPGVSPFAWLGLLPYLAGIMAAATASALVSTAHLQNALTRWAGTLDQAFKSTAFVLVASTVAMMLFYHLPLAVVEDTETRTLIGGFAQGMTLFWGIVFSLTLLAVFGPAQVMLNQSINEDLDTDKDLLVQIAERGTYHQAKQILTTLAPLLVGSSASVIDMLSGAFGT